MAEVALTEAWKRIDGDLSLAAGNYRLAGVGNSPACARLVRADR